MNKDFWQEVLVGTFFLFGVEVLFRVVSKYAILDYATLRIFCSCFILSLLIEVLFSFIKRKRKREMLFGIVLFIVTAYTWVQIGLRNFLGVYLSVGTSSQFHAVVSYVKEFLLSLKLEFHIVLIPMALYIVYFYIPKKWSKKAKRTIRWQSRGIGIFASCLIAALYFGTLVWNFMQNPIQMIPNSTLFVSPTNSSIAINQFGTAMFGLLDIKQLIAPKHILTEEFTNNNNKEMDEHDRNFDDSLWQEIIDEEENPVLKKINQYFISRTITPVNDYTGYFKGKNVIVIMLESVNNIILHEEYYPNFAKMLKHSWYWENNYSPRNSCATGDNEFSGMTSIYALNSSCTANTYQDNTYFSAIFNRFKDSGYRVSSYHDLDSTYYAREVFHYNMGSEEYYDGNRLGMVFDSSNFVEYPSDVEFIQKASAIFTQNEPFMAWLTTVTPHQPYDSSSVYGDKYLNLFDDTNYTITLKRYMSKLKVTDDALGALLDELQQKDLLDDTVIVLYGDHYPYGLVDSDVQAVVPYDMNEFYERERVPFLIYQADLEPQVFEEKTTYMNILPTLANLFDLDFDPRFYFGEDLFSDTYSNRIVFADSSWEDSIARYFASNGTVYYFGDKTYTTAELQKINQEIYQKKQMSKLAVSNNYFDYLEHKLELKQNSKKETGGKND